MSLSSTWLQARGMRGSARWPLLLLFVTLAQSVHFAHGKVQNKVVEPQLNVSSFAQCLQLGHAFFNVSTEVITYNLSQVDGLLVYLAVYAGDRFPLINKTIQEPAFERWGVAFWQTEVSLANSLKTHALKGTIITPSLAYSWALEACGFADGVGGHPFCAFLLCHNVFRTLGRWKENVDKHGVDYNPTWFTDAKEDWVTEYIPAIHKVLINLRRDNDTEKWGSWYHSWGLLAYGVQSMGVWGLSGGYSWEKFAVFMEALLNPIIAGAPEDPVKAEIDRQTVEVAFQFLSMQNSKTNVRQAQVATRDLQHKDSDVCSQRVGYVLQPWNAMEHEDSSMLH